MGFCNAAYYTVLQTGRCPLGVSWPGCAKTASLASFAGFTNRSIYVLIGSIREPSDFGIPFLSQDGGAGNSAADAAAAIAYARKANEQAKAVQKDLLKHGEVVASVELEPVVAPGRPRRVADIPHFVLAAPSWVANTFDGSKWLIVLDELTCCPPAVQAGMLRVIAENHVGDVKLPDDVWKCALANPSDIATNGFDIEPAMANRMVHLRWEMDWDSWKDGMRQGGHFPSPQFPAVSEDWKNRKSEVGTMFAAFQHHRPDAFRPDTDAAGNVRIERSRLSGAWPSPRSWDIAMDCRAAGMAAGVDKAVMYEMLEGCVGPVAGEYDAWENSLDLPDPKEVIDHAVAAIKAGKPVKYEHPNRPDKAIALLGSIANQIVGDTNNKKRYNVERYEAGLQIFAEAATKEVDIAIACVAQMLRGPNGTSLLPEGAKFPKDFVSRCFPVVQATHNLSGR